MTSPPASRRRSFFITLVALPLLKLLGSGCDAAVYAKRPNTSEPRGTSGCRSDADCVSALNEHCVSPGAAQSVEIDGGICIVASAPAAASVYFEINPMNSTQSPIQQWGPVVFSAGLTQDIVLPAPASCQGLLTSTDTAAVSSAVVLFSAHGGIPNHPPQPIQVTSDSSGSFQVQLPQALSTSYSVSVTESSAGNNAPPQYFADISTDALPPILSLPVWDPRDFVLLTGAITTAASTSTLGVQVTAASGLAGGGQQLIAQPVLTFAPPTGGTSGTFAITLPPVLNDPATVSLTFQSGAPSGVDFPTVTVPDLTQVTAQTVIDLGSGPTVAASLMPLDLTTTTVSGFVRDADQNVVPGAQIILVSQPAPSGTPAPFHFQVYATSTGEGDAAPGSYTVPVYTTASGTSVYYSAIAIPPSTVQVAGGPGLCRPAGSVGSASAHYAPTPFPVDMSAGHQVDLVCDRLISFTGSILAAPSAGGSPATEAGITAVLNATPDLPGGMTFTASTDQFGGFDVKLPVGSYTLTIQPSDRVNPVGVFGGVPVDTSTAGSPVTFSLPAPFNLSGVLYLGDTSHPLPAQINAYAVEGTNAFPIGTTVTGADGSYSLLLPETGT
jgi:hypothetical protein